MSYPKVYTSYEQMKQATSKEKSEIIRDDHERASFIENKPNNHKYKVRDLTEQELVENGYDKEHYKNILNKNTQHISYDMSGNSGTIMNQSSAKESIISNATANPKKKAATTIQIIKRIAWTAGFIASLIAIYEFFIKPNIK